MYFVNDDHTFTDRMSGGKQIWGDGNVGKDQGGSYEKYEGSSVLPGNSVSPLLHDRNGEWQLRTLPLRSVGI